MKSSFTKAKEICENGINVNIDKKAKLNWNVKFMGEPATYEEWLTQFFEGQSAEYDSARDTLMNEPCLKPAMSKNGGLPADKDDVAQWLAWGMTEADHEEIFIAIKSYLDMNLEGDY